MNFLTGIFGPPHEALHVLALWLIGRRAISATRTQVDIPDDLTLRQYLWVAGLPALVFWGAALAGLGVMATATTAAWALGGLAVMTVGGLAGFGTLGDIQLMIVRVVEEQRREPPE